MKPFEPQNLTKSLHEALILTSLGEGPRHGYQLALDIEERSGGVFQLKHGTLYPILHKLEKEGILAASWDRSGVGRRRKRYAITEPGIEYAKQQRKAWKDFTGHLLGLLEGDDA